MATNGNTTLGQQPLGITILKDENDGKTYVINEILNYYQCKLKVFTKDQAVSLSHHLFDEKKLEEAKSILLKLWNWKKPTPSSENGYIIKHRSMYKVSY